jgi:predicted acetyltransferase
VQLIEVGADDVRLARLLQLYIYEWSGLIEVGIGPEGLFAYEMKPGAAAFLVVDQESAALLGFALIEPHATSTWSVKEFFVLAGQRRRGIGRAATRALFATRPGSWTLTVRPENPLALGFWRGAMSGGEERTEVGADGIVRTRLTLAITPDPRGSGENAC